MITTFKVTNQELFDKWVDDIDTCHLTCTMNFGLKRNEFMATGDLFIQFKGDNWVTHSGDFFSDDYNDYGFQLIPKL